MTVSSIDTTSNIVTGPAGSGKTDKLIRMAVLSASLSGIKSIFISYEEYPTIIESRSLFVLDTWKMAKPDIEYIYIKQLPRGLPKLLKRLDEFNLYVDSNRGFIESSVTLTTLVAKAKSSFFTQHTVVPDD